MNEKEKMELAVKIIKYVLNGGGTYRELLYDILEVEDYCEGVSMGLMDLNNEIPERDGE